MERYLTEREEKQLFKTIASANGLLARRDEAWMAFLRNVGVRVSVLAGFTVGKAKRVVRYRQLELKAMKNGEDGTIPVNKKACESLRQLLKIRSEMGHAEDDEAPLIMSRNHRGISVRSLQSRMRYWVDLADLPVKASPHWFRHTLAMRIMAKSTAQNPINVVQKALVHSSIRSTQVYTQVNREELANSLEDATS